MKNHSLFITLLNLKGNARGAVFTEWLWGLPYNLFAPYVSIYMLTLGLKDEQIGLIVSIGLFFQMFTALLSGAITDKLGRKRTTLIFDILSWSVPCLIWAVAQNFYFFLAAALVNSMWRITMNSWTCLLVEGTEPTLLVDIYSWIYISGYVTAFFAPLVGLFINTFTLVPTMRFLYILAFIMMTTKFITMNGMVTETEQGQRRMKETKNQPIHSILSEYQGVFKQLLKTPRTLYSAGIMLILSISLMINNTFWSILATQKIRIPEQHLALYTFARSLIMLFFFFFAIPRIKQFHFKIPMLLGFAGFIISQLVLISVPEKNYLLLLASIFIEACSYATINPLTDRMVALTVDPQERARILSIIYVAIIVFTSPFGWIAGTLSGINRLFPFMLNILLFTIGGMLAYQAARLANQQEELQPVSTVER